MPKLCEVTRVSVLIFYYFPYLHLKVMFIMKIVIFRKFYNWRASEASETLLVVVQCKTRYVYTYIYIYIYIGT